MVRSFQSAAILLLAAAPLVCAQVDKAVAKPGGGAPFRPGVPKGTPKGAQAKGALKGPAPRIGNPLSPVAHLYKAPPEERDRVLEKVPFPLQKRMRLELEKFDQLPKEQREAMIRQTERFDALSDE